MRASLHGLQRVDSNSLWPLAGIEINNERVVREGSPSCLD